MVHSVSGRTRGVQVKLRDPLGTRAIPKRLRGVITTRRYTNPRFYYLYLYLYLTCADVALLSTTGINGTSMQNSGTCVAPRLHHSCIVNYMYKLEL